MKQNLIAFVAALVMASAAFGQTGVSFQTPKIESQVPQPIAGLTGVVCLDTALGAPCAPPVSVFSDKALTTPITLTTDGDGMFPTFFIAPGQYQWCASDTLGRIAAYCTKFTAPAASGSSPSFAAITVIGNSALNGNVLVGGTLGVTGATTLSSVNTIQMADQATGANWCAKTLAALSSNGEAFVNQNSIPGSCTTNITMPSGSVIHFIQAGHYVLSTFNIIPGTNTNVVCDTRGVVIDYSGTGAAWDDNTVTGAETHGCSWNALTTSPVAVLRVRNTGNSFNMNARVQAKLTATAYSAGQIGLLLQSDGATSSNYRSTYDIETDTLDIGVRNVSLVTNQSPNANIVTVRCNGHTVCMDSMDQTDSIATVLALGAHTAGTAIRLCATGNGGSGVSNSMFTVSSEQGGVSTTINVASAAGLSVGCGNSTFIGQTNDTNQYVDANATPTTMVILNTKLLVGSNPITGTGTISMQHGRFTGSVGATASAVPTSTSGDLYASRGATSGFVFLGDSGCFVGRNGASTVSINCGSPSILNLNGVGNVPGTIASGTAAMTTAGITTGACGTTVTVAASGAATTDTINVARNAAATIGNGGGLTLNAWPTANNVNFNYCNSSAGTITPTAMTINWQVTR